MSQKEGVFDVSGRSKTVNVPNHEANIEPPLVRLGPIAINNTVNGTKGIDTFILEGSSVILEGSSVRGNTLNTAAGDDAVVIRNNAYRNAINTGQGHDTTIQEAFFLERELPIARLSGLLPARYNTISGGDGIDTYRWIDGVGKDDRKELRFTLTGKQGDILVSRGDGVGIAMLKPDVEKFELNVAYSGVADGTYAIDMEKIRDALKAASGQKEGQAFTITMTGETNKGSKVEFTGPGDVPRVYTPPQRDR